MHLISFTYPMAICLLQKGLAMIMAKTRVCVIFGGVSSEHDISLMSASSVIQQIPKDKYEIICVGITKKGRWLYFPGDVSMIANGEWESPSRLHYRNYQPGPYPQRSDQNYG